MYFQVWPLQHPETEQNRTYRTASIYRGVIVELSHRDAWSGSRDKFRAYSFYSIGGADEVEIEATALVTLIFVGRDFKVDFCYTMVTACNLRKLWFKLWGRGHPTRNASHTIAQKKKLMFSSPRRVKLVVELETATYWGLAPSKTVGARGIAAPPMGGFNYVGISTRDAWKALLWALPARSQRISGLFESSQLPYLTVILECLTLPRSQKQTPTGTRCEGRDRDYAQPGKLRTLAGLGKSKIESEPMPRPGDPRQAMTCGRDVGGGGREEGPALQKVWRKEGREKQGGDEDGYHEFMIAYLVKSWKQVSVRGLGLRTSIGLELNSASRRYTRVPSAKTKFRYTGLILHGTGVPCKVEVADWVGTELWQPPCPWSNRQDRYTYIHGIRVARNGRSFLGRRRFRPTAIPGPARRGAGEAAYKCCKSLPAKIPRERLTKYAAEKNEPWSRFRDDVRGRSGQKVFEVAEVELEREVCPRPPVPGQCLSLAIGPVIDTGRCMATCTKNTQGVASVIGEEAEAWEAGLTPEGKNLRKIRDRRS
ncbi:hypothetical protein DFH06DRAFT_1119420 [Mycena polygramma]|nr:hypothetical protein DFH06DRAFT_1119420 [Mycena polygramma]